MASEKKNFIREVTFDGHVIVDIDAVLADPDVRRDVEKLGKAFKLARTVEAKARSARQEPQAAT